jgi:DNA-binding NarL/FixJ family response regulator
MRYPRVVVYESDGLLAQQLRALVEEQRWVLREPRQVGSCLTALRRGGPGVLVLKVGRDLEREFALLDRVRQSVPDTKIVVVCDVDHPRLAGVAWDLGAACVLVMPLAGEVLPSIVAGLMGGQP